DFIETLKQHLDLPLPGKEIQYQMAPEDRDKKVSKETTSPRKGAVLILLFKKNNKLYFLLTERTDNLKFHGGQISFPGGLFENKDKTLKQTALRETFEETGFKVLENQIIGKLTPLYIPVSNFQVFPFVAFSPETPKWKKNDSEVKLLIEVSLTDFLYQSPLEMEKLVAGGKIKIPCFLISNKVVWGATAMILNEFKAILKQEHL
ncbi:MAG: CoA pyrophosphatase, partial [Bacteroidales bacterium]|nr:CoA pyrophosphatase [Bacteroidales bacterium]